MIRYLSGCTSDAYEADLIDIGCGLLPQPGNRYMKRVPRFPAWAMDNGRCKMIDGVPVLNPDWTCADWARMFGQALDLSLPAPLFALVPDTPCDHDATLADFRRYLPIVRVFGFPVGFAIQNGATVGTVPWDDFDVAFLAGDDPWKCGVPAMEMAFAARSRDKHVHMGRVNSWDRLDWASRIGCDSADGTFMRFGAPAKMLAQLRAWRLDEGGAGKVQAAFDLYAASNAWRDAIGSDDLAASARLALAYSRRIAEPEGAARHFADFACHCPLPGGPGGLDYPDCGDCPPCRLRKALANDTPPPTRCAECGSTRRSGE